MMAIARAVLALEPRSRVTLVYGNRGEADILFRSAIDELARAHAARFTVRHVLEHASPEWSGGRGRLDEGAVRAELDALAVANDADFFLCGPEPMMLAARAALIVRGASPDRIAEERFASLRSASPANASDGAELLTLRRGDAVRTISVPPAKTLLEAGLAAGVPMPYSCAMGGCAACKVKLCDGEVEMDEPNCLTADERARGYVLACVSRVKRAATIDVPEVA
jgi:ferredoxin-NADP reductase